MLKTFGKIHSRHLPAHFGLALSGGGARGLAHIAVLEVLDELELQPREIAGTSMGALIGALYASGMPAKTIRRTFLDLNLMDLGKLVDVRIGDIHGLVEGNKIEATLRQMLGKTDFHKLRIPLKVVATDCWTGKPAIIKTGLVHRAVRASISIPGVFVPVKHHKHVLFDGGNSKPLPYDVLSASCKTVLAVDVIGEPRSNRSRGSVPNIMDSLLLAFQIQQQQLVSDLFRVKRPSLYLKPRLKGIRLLDFHKARQCLRLAADDARRLKNALARHL